ncbi:IclR family transcriptional regulator [Leucobacter insecticola]|uniref:IclR family transcriptional regulator n=1 Tax=Leucobacter insecticola TaxID=2714934 RepID=A0A6G8FG98_9MICO|nr:IclR family transcriptional regulator [Leucobacter insecticola]QIM15421.1 IclR family transcriptional regulator [Leucobacter insecticola]
MNNVASSIDPAGASTPGTQVVGRVAAVLRSLSTTMPGGASTSDIARSTGLSRPTTHRLLSALGEHGFVDRDPASGRWLLGPELYLMGTVAAERYDITELAREHVLALAEATGESAFLSARRGGETICLLRQDGSFPIRSFVLTEGKRFPLGVASAGIAILSFLPDDTIRRYLSTASLAQQYGDAHSPTALQERIAATRRTGYAENPGLIVEGSWGMGAAVFDPAGNPAWALSLTGVETRFSPGRRPELGRLLLEHAHRLTQRLAQR